MQDQTPSPKNDRIALIVIAILFLALAFYFTFILSNIAQGMIWFGAAFAFFILINNPKGR